MPLCRHTLTFIKFYTISCLKNPFQTCSAPLTKRRILSTEKERLEDTEKKSTFLFPFLINKMCLWCPWIMACNLGPNIWFTVCYQIRAWKVFIDKTNVIMKTSISLIYQFFTQQSLNVWNVQSQTNVPTLCLEHRSILNYGFILKCSQTLRR